MADRARRYSAVSIFLHWAIAFAIAAQIFLGWRMEDLPSGLAKFEAFQFHKSLGLTILTLSLLRLAWRLANPAPPLPDTMAPATKFIARANHVLLYVAMIGVPLLGWATVSSSPRNIPTEVWGVIPWPDLPLPNEKELSGRLGDVHGAAVWALIGLVALHVAGALKHQFINQDYVVWRMLPIVKPIRRGLRR